MKITIDGSSVRSAAKRTASLVSTGLGRAYGAVVVTVAWLASNAGTIWRRGHSWLARAVDRASAALGAAPLGAGVDILRRGLFGRRLDISAALVVLVAPALAAGANYWAAGVGYLRIQQWVRGTWYGTDPQTAVFLAAGGLVALAAASAAANSGLVPTTVLAAGPVFGAAFTRYGLVLEPYGTVSLPNAVGIGLLVALAFAVPFACVGFVVGTVARLIATRVESGDNHRAPQ
jgi:hypothetical protein